MIRLLTDAVDDLRYALRTFRRQPMFVAVAVVSLAVGIGLNAAVFSIINAIFFQSIRGVEQPHAVVNVGGRESFAAFREVRDRSRALAGVAAWQPIGVDLRIRGLLQRRVVPAVSEGYFQVLGVRPARGRFFDAGPSRYPATTPEAVLDYEFWQTTLGGDDAVLGETLRIGDAVATIVGIAPRSFHGFGPERPALWIPLGMTPAIRSRAAQWDHPGESGWRIFGRLRQGATPGDVSGELQALAAQSPALFPKGALRASAVGERWSGPTSPEKQIEFLLVVVLPLVVVALILWIGCSNVANLLLARAAARRKEIAVRLASGATRLRLVKLLLVESLLLAAAGGMLGLLLATWTMTAVWALLPDVPRLAVALDSNVLLYTAAVCGVATLFFGLVPALHATRVDVAPLLKGEASAAGQHRRTGPLRRLFLVTQFASSMALLVVAATFVRAVVSTHVGEQAAAMDHLALGYVESREPSAASRAAYWSDLRQRVLGVPHVTAVSLTEPAPAAPAALVPDGAEADPRQPPVAAQHVDPDFFNAIGFAMLAGSGEIASVERSGIEHVVVNQRAAERYWPRANAVGRRFRLGESPRMEIAGVVDDRGTEPRVFRHAAYERLTTASILVRTSGPAAAAVEPLQRLFVELSRDRVFTRVTTLREAATGGLERLTRLALLISGVVLALATIGLYGSVSFVTSQRSREIAIRTAVGAPRGAVLRLLAREGLQMVAAGSLLGLAAAALAFQFMSGMIFATWRVDPFAVAGVAAVLSIATIGACYVPGRRALRIDPISVLREP